VIYDTLYGCNVAVHLMRNALHKQLCFITSGSKKTIVRDRKRKE